MMYLSTQVRFEDVLAEPQCEGTLFEVFRLQTLCHVSRVSER